MECTADQHSFYSLLLFLETCTGQSPMNAAKFKLEYTLRPRPLKQSDSVTVADMHAAILIYTVANSVHETLSMPKNVDCNCN